MWREAYRHRHRHHFILLKGFMCIYLTKWKGGTEGWKVAELYGRWIYIILFGWLEEKRATQCNGNLCMFVTYVRSHIRLPPSWIYHHHRDRTVRAA